MRTDPTVQQALIAENVELRAQLEEAKEMLRAIHSGEVDALVIEGDAGPQVYALQGLDAESNRFRGEILAQVSDAVIATDNEQHVTYFNAAAERQYGMAASEALGRDLTEIYQSHWPGPDDENAAMSTLIETGQWRGTSIHVTRKGERIHVESAVTRLRAVDGTPAGMLAVIRDISERQRAEALREGLNRVLEMIVTDAPLPRILETLVAVMESQSAGALCSVLLLDEDGRHLRHGAAVSLPSEYLQSINGHPIGPDAGSCGTALHRREPVFVNDIQQDPLCQECRDVALRHGLRACWSHPIFSHHGKLHGSFVMYYREPHNPTTGERQMVEAATHIAGIAIEHQRAESHMRHLAGHDTLTGLPNRAQLERDLREVLRTAERDKLQAALLFIDLDDFKQVNDTLGHPVGDRLLQAVAGRLQHCLRSGDSVARLGGDEFVICVQRTHGAEEAALVASKVLEALGRTYEIDDHALQIGGSIGIALYPSDGTDAAMLMRAADVAMYHAKALGRGNYQFFTLGLDAAVASRRRLAHQLRVALPQGEFSLRYQPQVELRSGRIFGAEALLRWSHPDGVARLPADFVPLAEENKLILPIGNWVLREACTQLKRWHDAGFPDLRVAVNVSVHQLLHSGFEASVESILGEINLPADTLDLEITESVLMRPSHENHATLANLHTMGVRIMVDDFGTGYSNLAYLRGFPIDTLKIDQSFVQGIGEDANDSAIVDTIIAMSRSLRMNVIAEGVETAEQAKFLQQHGCPTGQGYYFDEPLTADIFSQRLSAAN
ncbi:MAG: EAL domain-containing protein [Rhodocyclaceae bacterium]|nr:EAL domain-containing protein [Rhodocyclaceae bacterium]